MTYAQNIIKIAPSLPIRASGNPAIARKMRQQVIERHLGQGNQAQTLSPDVEVERNGIRHENDPDSRRLGRQYTVARILEDQGLLGPELERIQGRQEQVRSRFDLADIVFSLDNVEIVKQAEALEMSIHPTVRRAGSNGQFQPALFGRFEIIFLVLTEFVVCYFLPGRKRPGYHAASDKSDFLALFTGRCHLAR